MATPLAAIPPPLAVAAACKRTEVAMARRPTETDRDYVIAQQGVRNWWGCGCSRCVRAWTSSGSFFALCCDSTRRRIREGLEFYE